MQTKIKLTESVFSSDKRQKLPVRELRGTIGKKRFSLPSYNDKNLIVTPRLYDTINAQIKLIVAKVQFQLHAKFIVNAIIKMFKSKSDFKNTWVQHLQFY